MACKDKQRHTLIKYGMWRCKGGNIYSRMCHTTKSERSKFSYRLRCRHRRHWRPSVINVSGEKKAVGTTIFPFQCRQPAFLSSRSTSILQWRHNERNGVSNHRRFDCLFTQPFVQAQIKENIKAPRHWPLWAVTGGFPSQRASNAKDVSIWWRHCDHSIVPLLLLPLTDGVVSIPDNASYRKTSKNSWTSSTGFEGVHIALKFGVWLGRSNKTKKCSIWHGRLLQFFTTQYNKLASLTWFSLFCIWVVLSHIKICRPHQFMLPSLISFYFDLFYFDSILFSGRLHTHHMRKRWHVRRCERKCPVHMRNRMDRFHVRHR